MSARLTSKAKLSEAWKTESADDETITVKRWTDRATGQVFEEIEPIPNPPQGDYRRSSDGLRRKLTALLGGGSHPFTDLPSKQMMDDNNDNNENEFNDNDNVNKQIRSAEDLQNDYRKGHAIDIKLTASGSNRRDEVADVDTYGYPEIFDDHIHLLNVDALRLSPDESMLRNDGFVASDDTFRGVDGTSSGNSANLSLEYITSVLKDAGVVNESLRGIESSHGGAKSAGIKNLPKKQPTHVMTRSNNQHYGERGTKPLDRSSIVRKVLIDLLNSSVEKTPRRQGFTDASAPVHRSLDSVAAYIQQRPEILGRALLAALIDFAPATKSRLHGDAHDKHTNQAKKLKVLEQKLGQAAMSRIEWGLLTSSGPQKTKASAEARVREIVLNTLAIKIADALESCADSRIGDLLPAAPMKSEVYSSSQQESDGSTNRISAARAILGALLGSDVIAATSRTGDKSALRAGASWGEELKRWAREASADSDTGASDIFIDEEKLKTLETKLLLAFQDGVKISERISKSMLATSSVEAPKSLNAAEGLSADDRTIVSKLLALNATSDGLGAPLQRTMALTDSIVKETFELERGLHGQNEKLTELVTPETLLRSWVISGGNGNMSNNVNVRALPHSNESSLLLRDNNDNNDPKHNVQLALLEAADVLRARSFERSSDGMEYMSTRSTSPRRAEREIKKIEYRKAPSRGNIKMIES